MRAIGYVRVSTDEQARDGVSLGAQLAKVRGYCALHGIDLVDVETGAGESAKSLDRPALAAALGRLDAGEADGLVVAKLDRLTRSLRDWDALISGYFGPGPGGSPRRSLWSVGDSIDTTTAGGRLVLNLLMTVAQWEREGLAERTREALRFKRSRGERVGSIPIGTRLGGDGIALEPNPVELQVLALVGDLGGEGLGPRGIARRLADLGHVGRGGRPWSVSTIRRILARSSDG